MKAATLTVLAMLSAVPMVGIAAQPAEGNSDHQQMLAKLKITSPLRPGPAGRLNADGTVPPNYANYDESKATAESPVPPLLVMNDGRKITTPAMWEERRKELFEIFDREFYSRQPEAARSGTICCFAARNRSNFYIRKSEESQSTPVRKQCSSKNH